MQKVNNILNLLIEAKVARTSNVQVEDETAANYIAAGEVVVTSVDGTIITNTTGATVDKIVIVQGQGVGKPLIKSPVIEKAKLTTAKGAKFVADVDQITYWGYDGTSGAIDAINDNNYILRITRREGVKTYGNKLMTKFGDYVSDSTATQAEVSENLVNNIILNWKKEREKNIKPEQTNSGTRTAVPTGAGTITFTKGSDKVVFNTAIDDATGTAKLVVGDYLTVAAAKTNAVYRVTAIDVPTETATIAIPFQGDTETVANATAKFVRVADIGDFGIKLTGADGKFEPGIFKYDKFRFVLTAQNGGSTPVNDATGASEGTGTGKQVSEIEWEVVGNEGAIERIGVPSPTIRLNAEQTKNYALINLEFYDQAGSSILGNAPSYKQLMLAMKDDSGLSTGVSDATTGLKAVLEAFSGETLTLS